MVFGAFFWGKELQQVEPEMQDAKDHIWLVLLVMSIHELKDGHFCSY